MKSQAGKVEMWVSAFVFLTLVAHSFSSAEAALRLRGIGYPLKCKNGAFCATYSITKGEVVEKVTFAELGDSLNIAYRQDRGFVTIYVDGARENDHICGCGSQLIGGPMCLVGCIGDPELSPGIGNLAEDEECGTGSKAAVMSDSARFGFKVSSVEMKMRAQLGRGLFYFDKIDFSDELEDFGLSQKLIPGSTKFYQTVCRMPSSKPSLFDKAPVSPNRLFS